MRTTGLAEAADENGVGCFQKPEFRLNTRLFSDLFENFGKTLKAFAFANIDDNGCLRGGAFGFQDQFVKFGD